VGREDKANEPMCTSTTCTFPVKIIAKVDGGGNENNLPGIGKWLRKKKLAAPPPSPRLQFQRTVKAFCCKRGKEIGEIGPKCCRVYTCTASIG